jgi:TRAP-type C4-dicarboxylate transport system permease small subunit
MLLIGADVFLRYVFSSPVPGTLEISEVLPVILTYFGLGFTSIMKRHIRATFVLDRLHSASIKSTIELICSLLMFLFLSLLIWRMSSEGLSSLHVREYSQGIIPVPIYPVKVLVPAALFVGWLYYIWEIIQILRRKVAG